MISTCDTQYTCVFCRSLCTRLMWLIPLVDLVPPATWSWRFTMTTPINAQVFTEKRHSFKVLVYGRLQLVCKLDVDLLEVNSSECASSLQIAACFKQGFLKLREFLTTI